MYLAQFWSSQTTWIELTRYHVRDWHSYRILLVTLAFYQSGIDDNESVDDGSESSGVSGDDTLGSGGILE